MIAQRNLSALANRLAQEGGRRIPERVLERDYCIAWFLVGLSRSGLAVAFKGGTALKRCYILDYRFSDDLDFTLIEPIPFERILRGLEALFGDVRRLSGVGFRFLREDRPSGQNTYTFYIGYDGPIPHPAADNPIKLDITVQELIFYPLQTRPILRHQEYSDLPHDVAVRVYALEEIATEKIMALTAPARNEPRDLYDLWFLTERMGTDLVELSRALEKKLESKGRPALHGGELTGKKERLRRDWDRRLAEQVVELPEFEAVFRAVQRNLRRSRLTGPPRGGNARYGRRR